MLYNIIVSYLNNARKTNQISTENLTKCKEGILKLGANDFDLLIKTWDVDLVHSLQNNDFENALKISNAVSEKFPNGQTQLALFEILNKNTSTDQMNAFFEAKKVSTLKDLKTKAEKMKFYVQAAKFYSKSKNKTEAQNAFASAQKMGLIGKDLLNL